MMDEPEPVAATGSSGKGGQPKTPEVLPAQAQQADLREVAAALRPLAEIWMDGQKETTRIEADVKKAALDHDARHKRRLVVLFGVAVLLIFSTIAALIIVGLPLEAIELLKILLGYAVAFAGGYGIARVEVRIRNEP